MKKNIAIAVLIVGLGVAGFNQAFAGWGGRSAGFGGGYGGGYCGYCPQYQGQQPGQVDPAMQEKIDKFVNDTQDIRKELVMKQAEQMALMRTDSPDPAAASKLAGDIFDLRSQMHQKAAEAGVSDYLGPRAGGGFGPGMGGPGMRGGGRGARLMDGNMMGGSRF